jgi:UTP--glucose-1-phosphate uridylyltransferase
MLRPNRIVRLPHFEGKSRMAKPIMKVRKAVLPAAGLGTRFLPATKAQPKEMLPVVDKPLIQYSVEECIASGIEHIIIITGRRKNAIEDHFDLAPELERFLEEHGRSRQAEMIREISGGIHFSYTRQSEALGLGHAVLLARELVGDEPFAVLLGDVIHDGIVPATKALMEVYAKTGQGAITVEEVPPERVQLYGIVDVERDASGGLGDRYRRIRDVVEKPAPDQAPSNLAVTGRYILPPKVFEYIENTEPGRNGEIQLTDALRLLAKNEGLWAYTYEGSTLDAGDKLGFLRATVEMALKNPELGPSFRNYLKTLKL